MYEFGDINHMFVHSEEEYIAQTPDNGKQYYIFKHQNDICKQECMKYIKLLDKYFKFNSDIPDDFEDYPKNKLVHSGNEKLVIEYHRFPVRINYDNYNMTGGNNHSIDFKYGNCSFYSQNIGMVNYKTFKEALINIFSSFLERCTEDTETRKKVIKVLEELNEVD